MTLPELLAAANPLDSSAIDCGEGRRSYGELDALAGRWAGAIARAVAAGGPVAVQMDRPFPFVAAVVGAWRAGCPVLPLDPALEPPQVAAAVAEACARLLVTERPSAADGVPVMAEPDDAAPASRAPVGAEPALLLYTSGTTGTAKCVVYSHDAMVRQVRALLDVTGLTADDRVFTPLPPALTTALATCVLPGLAAGASLVLPGRVLPQQTAQLLTRGGVTVFAAVPFVYHLLGQLRGAGPAPGELRMAITNSAPMAGAVADAFERRFGLLPRSNYCSSEAGGITFNGADDRGLLLESVGTPLPGVRVRIVDADGHDLPAGEEGRIVVGSPMLASAYLNRTDLTAETFRDGTVQTDDLGWADSDGYIRITGRASSLVNVAGHLVNPAAVEAILLQHPGVAEAMVTGEADEAAGEVLAALVVPRAEVDARDVREFCFQRLPIYQVPRVRLVESLARTSLGKLRRSPVEA